MKSNILKKQILTVLFTLYIVSSKVYADANIIYAPTKAPTLPQNEVANSLPQNTTSRITPEAEVASTYEFTANSIDFNNVYNIVEDNNNFYCYENGNLVKSGWRMISKASFSHFAPVDSFSADYIWAFFTNTGKALKASSGKIRKAKFGKYNYAFNEYGQLLTGFFNDNGEMWTESDDDDPFDLLSDGNNLYHANELNGALTEGWYKLANASSRYPYKDTIWLYFTPSSCKLARSTGSNYKSVNIGGKTYAFDDNGVMLTGFEATQYNIDHGGNPKNVYFGPDGAEVRSGFFTVDMSDESNFERFEEYDNYDDDIKIYLNKGGKVYSNTITKIGAHYYGFDQNGVMLTGLTVWNNGNYITTIDVESTNGKTFINDGRYATKNGGSGTLSSTDTLHYFDKTGKRSIGARLDFSDTEYTYGASNYGAYNGRQNSSFYIHGLLLKPLEGAKYGVYIVNPTKQRYSMAELCKTENVVVNRNGKTEIGHNTIKDEDDNYWLVSNSSLLNVYTVPIRYSGNENTYYFESTNSSGYKTWIKFGDKDSQGRTCVLDVTPNGTRLAGGAVSMYQNKIYQDNAINFYIN